VPAVTITGNTDLCAGESVKLSTETGYDNYTWLNGTTVISSATTNELTVSEAGSYSVKVKNNNSCFIGTSIPVNVTVTPLQTYYLDADGDGYGSTTTGKYCPKNVPANYVSNNTDCDDGNASIHAPVSYYIDTDGDGFGTGDAQPFCSLTIPAGYSDNNTDCNDADPNIHVAATYYRDADGDSFGDASNTTLSSSSVPPQGYVKNSLDCDDTKILYNDGDGDGYGAGSPVACGIADNRDCNDADANLHTPITYYKDNDGDHFGDLNDVTSVCSLTAPGGYVSNSLDCDDTKLLYTDADGDGYGTGSPGSVWRYQQHRL
jgi:hypothetical protein